MLTSAQLAVWLAWFIPDEEGEEYEGEYESFEDVAWARPGSGSGWGRALVGRAAQSHWHLLSQEQRLHRRFARRAFTI